MVLDLTNISIYCKTNIDKTICLKLTRIRLKNRFKQKESSFLKYSHQQNLPKSLFLCLS